jgi:hypothetical protein
MFIRSFPEANPIKHFGENFLILSVSSTISREYTILPRVSIQPSYHKSVYIFTIITLAPICANITAQP